MSAAREAFAMPLAFLTVALAGGLRLGGGGQLTFLPPPLMALVLGALVLVVMARGGLLVTSAFVSETRGGLENLSGVVALLSLFAASAQAFHCVTPDSGLYRVVFDVLFLFLLWNTLAVRPARDRLLHSLGVVFGGAFILRYVMLDALYDPGRGWARRLLTALLEGATVGSIEHAPSAPAGGYVAFATIALYLLSLGLLPRAVQPVQESQGGA